MANAYVEHNGREISLDEYEATVTMDQSELLGITEPTIVSEYDMIPGENTVGPDMTDLYMLTFVQGQRIYDLLSLLISTNTDPAISEAARKLFEIHSKGGFLAPLPRSPEPPADE